MGILSCFLKIFKKDKNLNSSYYNENKTFGNRIKNILTTNKVDKEKLKELEKLLLSFDLGLKTTNLLIENLAKNTNKSQLDYTTQLKQELNQLITDDKVIDTTIYKPFILLIIGVNGSGKTTMIGKLTNFFQKQNKSVLLAACDTFRAAAKEQLKKWGELNKVRVISAKSSQDPASIAFDAVKSAEANNTSIVIIDTAGRLQNNTNLMAELKKIKKVLQKIDINTPHETMLILDGNTGQSAIKQADVFKKEIGVDSISITKLDGTAKGGVLFAIANEYKLPIRFIGIGEGVEDIRPFKKQEFINNLL